MDNINLSINLAPLPPAAPASGAGMGGLSQGAAADLVSSLYGNSLVDKIKEMVNSRPEIPQARQESIGEALNAALENSGVDSSMSSSLSPDLLEAVKEHLEKFAQETAEDAGKSADESSAGAAGGGGGAKNWLVALAKAMGEVAGKHLENMVNLANKISSLDSGTDVSFKDASGNDLTGAALESAKQEKSNGDAAQAREMAALTAEMQAESQMFKMTQEMTTTVVKNIGEALHSTSRKQ